MRLPIRGHVEKGEGFATQLGCPTANIALSSGGMIPALGVYVGEASVDHQSYYALICINNGRTGTPLKLEVHLLGFNGDLVGKYMDVVIKRKVRDLIPYPGEKKMAEIIAKDMAQARAWAAQVAEDSI